MGEMKYISKKMAGWEIKYGQISITGHQYQIAKKIFDEYFGKTFKIKTFKGTFTNRHFIHEETRNSLRLACNDFFGKLSEGDPIHLIPRNPDLIEITNIEPQESDEATAEMIENKTQPKIEKEEKRVSSKTQSELFELIVDTIKENKRLREENEQLLQYKDRLEKYKNLDVIFEDEKFMEDWLERNIHKVMPSLEIIDRQPSISWKESFMRDRPDFFCINKTTREFVIVENKVRGRHRHIDSQILKYRAWVKRNLDKINEYYNKKEIIASQNFKFVIITDTTDEKLEAICEDNKIALVLIDGGVVFEEIIPFEYE
jgi:hypothetical protein